jgi:hypothetical protein
VPWLVGVFTPCTLQVYLRPSYGQFSVLTSSSCLSIQRVLQTSAHRVILPGEDAPVVPVGSVPLHPDLLPPVALAEGAVRAAERIGNLLAYLEPPTCWRCLSCLWKL